VMILWPTILLGIQKAMNRVRDANHGEAHDE
jgi:hypothetical protein